MALSALSAFVEMQAQRATTLSRATQHENHGNRTNSLFMLHHTVC